MLSIYMPMIVNFLPSTRTVSKPTVNFKYCGDIAPTKFFDPLKLSNEKNSKYLREFELQHGRVAMVAASVLPLIEFAKPDTLAIDFLAKMNIADQLPFWYLMAVLEFGRMKTGWVNPFISGKAFTLKDDFQPGNYFNLNVNKISERRFNTELSNGRLAMLASAHIIGTELLTGHSVFNF